MGSPTSMLDAFLNALDDSELRLKVLEREPKTVEEALNQAINLEAFAKSLASSGSSADTDGGRGRHKARTVTHDDGSSKEMQSMKQQLDQLQGAVAQATKKMESVLQSVGQSKASTLGASNTEDAASATPVQEAG